MENKSIDEYYRELFMQHAFLTPAEQAEFVRLRLAEAQAPPKQLE